MKQNKFINLIIVMLAGCTLLSCNKPDDVILKNEGTVYMPQAVGTRGKIDLLFTSTKTKQDIFFGAAYGGINYSSADINVSFMVDAAKVAAYNSVNGTNYTLLPTSSYDLSGLSSVISSGATSSAPLTITVKTNTVTPGIKYMLPITLSTSSNGSIDSSLKTTYFRFDTLIKKSIDLTGLATLTVSNENPGGSGAGEGSLKLVDNDINTKYLFFGFSTGIWFQLKFATASKVDAYTITSANDAPGRDPKNWIFQGSNDGITWTDIDTRTGELFPNRFQTKRYEISGTTVAYLYHRILVNANNGSPNYQQAEWRIIKYE